MNFELNPILGPSDYPMEALAKLKQERLAQNKRVFDFGTGDPKIPIEPFLNQALTRALPEIPQYPKVRGESILCEAISNYLERECSVQIEPHHLLPTSGSKEAVYHLYPFVFHEKTKRRGVIYPDPGYPVYASGGRFHGASLYPQVAGPETNYQIDLQKVPQKELEDSSLAWLCNPHNPTGAVGDQDWLKRQVEVAHKYGILLAIDECYFEIYANQRPPTALQLPKDDLKGVLVFHSLSKRSGFTAYRSGFVSGDPELVTLLAKMRAYFGVASPVFIQHMAAQAWGDQKHVHKRRDIFNKRRELVCQFLDRNHFSYCGGQATFYLWIRLTDQRLSEQEYCRILFDQAGIIASPGTFFGAAGQGHLRLALVPTFEETREALKLWQELIDSKHLPAGTP